MKKIFVYISLVFISLFVCCLNVKASELTCKYENPFGDEDIVFTFISENPVDYSIYEYVNYQNKEKKINGMYINPNNTTIDSFYVASHPFQSPNTYYTAPGSKSFSGASWIYAPSMVGNKLSDSNSCPSITYSHYSISGQGDTVVIHAGRDSDCSSGYATCTSLKLLQSGDADFVGSCVLPVKYKDVSQTITLTSYSDGSVKYSFDSGGSGNIDFNAEYPFTYSKTTGQGTNIQTTTIYVTKDELNKFVKLNSNNTLSCTSPVVCSEMYNSYTKRLFLSSSSDNCSTNILGDPNYNDVELEGDGDSDIHNISQVSKPSNLVNSNCVVYLGVAGEGDNIATFLDDIWDVIKPVSILLVIAFSMFDFSKAVTNDKEKIPEVVKKCVIRLGMLIALLLLPTLIDSVGQLVGVDNILCGIK